jgi:FkbH-like protein
VSSRKTRCLVLSDFNIEPLADFLRQDEINPACEVVVAPFGQVTPALLEISSGETANDYDAVIVWTQPEVVISAYGALGRFEAVTDSTLIAEVDAFADLIVNAAQRTKRVFVVCWSQSRFRRGLGLWSMRPDGSARVLMKMNLHLCDRLSRQANVYVLNPNAWLQSAGPKAHNAKLWYLAKIPFSTEVFESAAHDVKASLEAIEGRSRKLIVVDLDDTLWGGIVGEVGWENLQIGGHDPIGEAFADFQKSLKALSQSGIVLAIASKNDEPVALEAIDKHPEMILRRSDFAAWRINWMDKAQNIADIAAELNLDLSAIVYIDDSPAERSRVRSALPAVVVPEWPKDVFQYANTLIELPYFDRVAITQEDQQRTSMYVADLTRTETRRDFQSIEDWLQSLQIEVSVEELSRSNLARAAQLFNKTNQMNLRTRRLGEAELSNWSSAAGHQLYVFRVSDKFGDYGLTGILGLAAHEGHLEVTDYLLSCRVMGRGIEELMLGVAIDHARSANKAEVRAEYVPTSRNAPCLSFFKKSSGFRSEGAHSFVWHVRDAYTMPAHISVNISRAATR